MVVIGVAVALAVPPVAFVPYQFNIPPVETVAVNGATEF